MSACRYSINAKGFTLVEVLAVVVIIGILVAIAVPVYNNATAKANRRAVEANLRTIDSAIMQYTAANEGDIPTQADLIGYFQDWPVGPDGVEYDVSGTRAVISQESSGAWFTTEDVSLPITW